MKGTWRLFVKGTKTIIQEDVEGTEPKIPIISESSPSHAAYSPKFDKGYLDALIKKAAPKWAGVNADAWLAEIRGETEPEATHI